MNTNSDLDSQEVLKRAQELLDYEKNNNLDLKDKKEGSYEEEINKEIDNTNLQEENLEGVHHSKDDKFNLPKQGYKRVIHFKKPTICQIGVAIAIIVILFSILGYMMPYIPPVLA